MKFVNSNIFVRYLTADDPVKAAACAAFFGEVQAGREEAMTSEAIIAEVVYVLSFRTLYSLSPIDIQGRLSPVLALTGLSLPNKAAVVRALDLRVQYPHLDFPDALCIAHMERAKVADILSYDRDFDRIPSVRRQEP